MLLQWILLGQASRFVGTSATDLGQLHQGCMNGPLAALEDQYQKPISQFRQRLVGLHHRDGKV